MIDTIKFNPDKVKRYLDSCINFWRKERDEEGSLIAKYYIDAYQSVRNSLFGELLLPNDLVLGAKNNGDVGP